MNLELRVTKMDAAELLRDYVERRLRFAIGRFGNRVARVIVNVSREGGRPRESTCLMTVEVVPIGEISVYETYPDLLAAIDRAAGRVGRQVARQLKRAQQTRAWRQSIRMAA